MGNCPPIGPYNLPNDNIKRLAKYAKKAQLFRGNACLRDKFRDAVDDELDHGGKGQYNCLSRDEVLFCEGWIYAVDHEYIKADGTVDDAKLLDAIRRHVPDNDMEIMSG